MAFTAMPNANNADAAAAYGSAFMLLPPGRDLSLRKQNGQQMIHLLPARAVHGE